MKVIEGVVSHVKERADESADRFVVWTSGEFRIGNTHFETPRYSGYTPRISDGDRISAVVGENKGRKYIFSLRNETTSNDYPGPGWMSWVGVVMIILGLLISLTIIGVVIGLPAIVVGILMVLGGGKHRRASALLAASR